MFRSNLFRLQIRIIKGKQKTMNQTKQKLKSLDIKLIMGGCHRLWRRWLQYSPAAPCQSVFRTYTVYLAVSVARWLEPSVRSSVRVSMASRTLSARCGWWGPLVLSQSSAEPAEFSSNFQYWSGTRRESKVKLDHYNQTGCVIVSSSEYLRSDGVMKNHNIDLLWKSRLSSLKYVVNY